MYIAMWLAMTAAIVAVGEFGVQMFRWGQRDRSKKVSLALMEWRRDSIHTMHDTIAYEDGCVCDDCNSVNKAFGQ